MLCYRQINQLTSTPQQSDMNCWGMLMKIMIYNLIIPDFQENKKIHFSVIKVVVFNGVLNYNNSFAYYCFTVTINTERKTFQSNRNEYFLSKQPQWNDLNKSLFKTFYTLFKNKHASRNINTAY